jgi:type VI secretion system protein ImpL
MKAFFSSPIVKAILCFCLLLLVGLLIWFAGPLVAFGDIRPLASISARVTTIIVLLVFLCFLLLKWKMSTLALAVLCLLIWHATPLFSFGSYKPFEPVWVRVTIITLILLAYMAFWAYKFFQMLKTDQSFLKRFLQISNQSPQSGVAKDGIQTLESTAQRAVSQLKQMHINMADSTGSIFTKFRRVVEGKRYLYELPWYMIIGNPGAGKTTVLLNSGLKFPIAHQMGMVSSQMTLANDSGTLNCSWWFTNDAVLLDTAGRYTSQDDGESTQALSIDQEKSDVAVTVDQPQNKNAIEWQGFLGILRKVRSRAPINGALVAIDAAEVISSTPEQRIEMAAKLRARLAELRQELGVRFPVYVVVTKTDLVKGFNDYFSNLSAEGRSQVWGFTLPWQGAETQTNHKQGTAQENKGSLGEQLRSELALLKTRLSDGVPSRLQEEFDVDRRKRLYALPQEFAGLSELLIQVLEPLFLDSRFDSTQLTNSLRGVYFTSAAQCDESVYVAPNTTIARFKRLLAPQNQEKKRSRTGNRSFFVSDVLSKVVFPESHLVRPNLRWETRFRLLRLLGHVLVFFTFLWLMFGLVFSYGNNNEYLKSVEKKTKNLHTQASQIFSNYQPEMAPELLDATVSLTGFADIDDITNPPGRFTFGLYTNPPIQLAVEKTYQAFQDKLLLPEINRRMEYVLREAIANGDENVTYETLRAYLILHEPSKYDAQVIADWLQKDITEHTSNEESSTSTSNRNLIDTFGKRASITSHLRSMFSSDRVITSNIARNETLVRQAQTLLRINSPSLRIYERVKTALLEQSPNDFSLVSVLGSQDSKAFERISGEPIEAGVPGLFTYDGYHHIFDTQLEAIIVAIQNDDAWVMGDIQPKQNLNKNSSKNKLDNLILNKTQTNLVDDVRRLYLTEYAQIWSEFLSDIRPTTGRGLSSDLLVIGQLAAPNSPLSRLARSVAKETTLSRALKIKGADEQSLIDKVSSQVEKQTTAVTKAVALNNKNLIEKQLVDDRFAALREVVTGQSENGAAAGKGIEGITGTINELYTVLTMADAALKTGGMPPDMTDINTKVRLESGKLPAPFKEVISALANDSSNKIIEGASGILQVQAEAQMSRLMTTMESQIGDFCKRNIEGKYPFNQGSQEVAIEDFNQFFSSGGVLDDYFTKNLLPFVDTSSKPWRYKTQMQLSMESNSGTNKSGQISILPTVPGEVLKLLTTRGPNPDAFYKAQLIREAFFKESGAKKMTWKVDVKVLELDPSITEFTMDFDGQAQRYAHDQVVPMEITWPGPRGGVSTEMIAFPKVRNDTSTIIARGPWAMMRIFEKGSVSGTATGGRVSVDYFFDGRKVSLSVSSNGSSNPLSGDLLRGFRCPTSI